MKKKQKTTLNHKFIPRRRREYVDYDYLDKLDDELICEKCFYIVTLNFTTKRSVTEILNSPPDLVKNPEKCPNCGGSFVKISQYLDKFNREFYGADFEINKDNVYIKEDEEYIWIGDKDLRKYRKQTKYYKNKEGEFIAATTRINANGRKVEDSPFKYDKDNLHQTSKLRDKCNRSANENLKDLMSVGLVKGKGRGDAWKSFIDQMDQDLSMEDKMILIEEYLWKKGKKKLSKREKASIDELIYKKN